LRNHFAAAFVGFLIEKHGPGKFHQLYAMIPLEPGSRDGNTANPCNQVYGRELNAQANTRAI
jgi:hypothetical protein